MLEKLARPDLDRLLHRGLNRLSAESRRVAVLLEFKIELLLHCWMWRMRLRGPTGTECWPAA